jgi:cell shape-determining protein MreC
VFAASLGDKELLVTSMILTQTYLEPQQKKALTAQARQSGRKVSELMREAVDAAIAGVTTEDLRVLDEGTRRAQSELKAMLAELRTNAAEHAAFMRQMKKLRKACAS